MTIKPIIDAFLRSEWFANWQAENLESGGYARPGSDARDRFDRCYDAAEDGGDGSTHREHINDMREAFTEWIRARKRGSFAYDAPRLEAAADRYFDQLEAWHTANGSIDQEVG